MGRGDLLGAGRGVSGNDRAASIRAGSSRCFAFVVTVVALYVTGWAASHVFGRRLIAIFEGLIQRIPLAHTIYGGTKKLMSLMQKKPAGTQRVVLIDFPSPELKSVGFVTRIVQGRSRPRLRRRVCADDAESDRRLSRNRADRAARRDRLDRRSGDGFHPFGRRRRARCAAVRDRAAAPTMAPTVVPLM